MPVRTGHVRVTAIEVLIIVYRSAVPQGSYFKALTGNCIFLQSGIYVRLNMSEATNGQPLSLPKHNPRLPNGHQARYTAETVLRTRPKTYRKIVHLLADPYWSVLQISKVCRVSEHTVRAIREREAQDIAERKKSLAVSAPMRIEVLSGTRGAAPIGRQEIAAMINNLNVERQPGTARFHPHTIVLRFARVT